LRRLSYSPNEAMIRGIIFCRSARSKRGRKLWSWSGRLETDIGKSSSSTPCRMKRGDCGGGGEGAGELYPLHLQWPVRVSGL